MNGFLYTLTLEEPVLTANLGGEPNSASSLFYIPGGALRGAFIAAYSKTKEAENDDFRRLFLDGQTRYLNAYPLQNEQRCLPTPLTWQVKRKVKDDTLYSYPPKDEDTGKPNFNFWYSQNAGQTIIGLDEEWQINIHTQRDAEKGHATIKDGAVYRYIALPAGMTLQGAVLTETSKDATTLQELFKDQSILLGKARTAGYGRAKICTKPLGNWRENSLPHATPEKLTLTLLSHAIVRDANGQASLDIEAALKSQFPTIKIEERWQRAELIAGFNRKWGLPMPQVTAIAAGSLFIIKGVKADDLLKLEDTGLGERRAEGFGRVAVSLGLPTATATWKNEEINLAESTSYTPATLAKDDKLAKQMLTRLLRRDWDARVMDSARELTSAYTKPENTQTIPNSQLSRWRVALRDALGKTDSIERMNDFKENAKDKLGWKKMDKVRIQSHGQSQRLTGWIESLLKNPETWKTAIEAEFPPQRSLGSVSIDDDLNAEYCLRLIEAVLAVMSKKVGQDA